MSEIPPSLITTHTIYDPDTKDFETLSTDAKALPNIKEWINQHNPAIYWYVLRIDNLTDTDISQWAVHLCAHQALTIKEAYVDGSDRKFDLKKREHDDWNEKYVLSISRQIGIPLVGKGTRRIYFKVDIDCKEGLMHEYGISGKFVAQGMEPVEIKEKMFKYSCKVGEFKQIFNKDPYEASHYAEKKLAGKYSSNAIHNFTNSFRLIYELNGNCHSKMFDRDGLLQKLQLLKASFEDVPEIAGKRITPFINDEIFDLNNTLNRDEFARRAMELCDALVELLHIEVMGAEMKGANAYTPPSEPVRIEGVENGFSADGQKECPACGNVISESNKALICMECGTHFCYTCEEWFRKDERKRGQKPLCENCFDIEQDRLREVAERRKREEEKRKRKDAEEHERKAKEEHDLAKEGNSIGIKFTHIPAGEFMMGFSENEKGWWDYDAESHKVSISKPFYLGTYPVTQREWKAVMGDNPSSSKGDDLPVNTVSWDDVQDFIKKLNQKESTIKYRLPSEAEWEYACRAGTTTKYSFGNDKSRLGDYAWYGNIFGKIRPVGQKKPNPWGLYDMHGNVWEWVQDWYHSDYDGAPTDGSAWESRDGSYRVGRGGGWYDFAQCCRSANRYYGDPGLRLIRLGFRLLREP